MAKAILDNNMIATVAGDITIFNFKGDTREFLSSSIEYIPIGVGLPANSCTDAPPVRRKGKVVCRAVDGLSWESLADHRGEIIYSTTTGQPVEVSAPGEFPAGTTMLAPITPYDVWSGTEWVTDRNAQHAAEISAAESKRASLLSAAQSAISIWQTELTLGIITDDDKASLITWLAYVKALKVVDCSSAPDISWPEQP
ncbi:tail fiber assembly protein [Kosakonia sp.]|uniref:tail fiber assembly protein n=1 Tax=Kosakonia sp. TaxID=1916651 RepID=UPI0028AA99E0|nr:tail fiber assembly protein [Kosakonia sp.]